MTGVALPQRALKARLIVALPIRRFDPLTRLPLLLRTYRSRDLVGTVCGLSMAEQIAPMLIEEAELPGVLPDALLQDHSMCRTFTQMHCKVTIP